MIITLNQFIAYMRQTALLFRNASGTFYYDRWKPIAEGAANLVLSLLFVHIFPEDLKVVGVIVATIITSMCICHIVDPFVVYKHVFGKSVKEYYQRNYSYIGLFVVAVFFMSFLMKQENGIIKNGLIAIGMSVIVLGLAAAVDKPFRKELMMMGYKIKGLIINRIFRN